jgi:hypothetical protein
MTEGIACFLLPPLPRQCCQGLAADVQFEAGESAAWLSSHFLPRLPILKIVHYLHHIHANLQVSYFKISGIVKSTLSRSGLNLTSSSKTLTALPCQGGIEGGLFDRPSNAMHRASMIAHINITSATNPVACERLPFAIPAQLFIRPV